MVLIFNKSNDEIHYELVEILKEKRKQDELVLLDKRQYILPMQLLTLMLTYLPGYYIVWLPSGEMTIKRDMPLSIPIKCEYIMPRSYLNKDDLDYDYESDYEEYEQKYNPDYD